MITRSGTWLDVRWFDLGDVPQIVSLLNAGGARWTASDVCAFAGTDGSGCFVVVDPAATRLAAVLCYRAGDDANDVRIVDCVVAPEFRRQGIGTQLLRQLTGGKRRARATRFTAAVDEHDLVAQLFLKSIGFRAVPPFSADEGTLTFELAARAESRGRIRRPRPVTA